MLTPCVLFPNPCLQQQLTGLFHPWHRIMPIVTKLSQSSDDEEAEQCIDSVQNNAAAASSAPAASSNHKSSSWNTTLTTFSLPPRPSKPLVQSGLFGFKVVQATKMVSFQQFKKKTGSKAKPHSRKQSSFCHSAKLTPE